VLKNLAPEIKNEYKNYCLSPIGIFSKNREEWVISDFAGVLYNKVLIPFYDTLGKESITYVLKNSNISSCICSSECLDLLLKAPDLIKLKTVICLDPITQE
jgi:long-chain acyl-CoA synthetase